jgi:DNA repair protein RecN (Recombination protein N)
MLQSLHIENYALIDRLALDFASGLNLLTGETGSGKSIVVDALAILLGGRASPEVVRAGAERAVLCGVFQSGFPAPLRRLAEELGLEAELGGRGGSPAWELLVRREVQANGRTRVFLNDRPATVAALRGLAPWLADIHGQSEHQALFEPAAQLELLDRFAAAEELAEQVGESYRLWRAAAARLADLTRNEQEKLRLADLWAFQKKEIEAAHPALDEDQRLAEERRVLANSARIHALAQAAYEQVYDGAEPAVGALALALKSLEEVARLDRSMEGVCDGLRSARIVTEDAAISLRDYLERLDANPQRLEQLEDRLAVLDRLKRKYGPTLADVLTHLETVSRQLEELESSDVLARQAQQQLDAAAERYSRLASELSSRRKAAGARLEKGIARILNELAMEKTAVKIEFEPAAAEAFASWKESGLDRIRFLISPNPGEPLRPLEQVASGGELSRVMLAMKTAVEASREKQLGASGKDSYAADADTARTLVFDEIDAGIGGRVAEVVGRKLKSLAARHQVLCVTHLPQIACFADYHYFVEKVERDKRTITLARRLQDSERIPELARMLGGARVTETALKHGRELLRAARSGE